MTLRPVSLSYFSSQPGSSSVIRGQNFTVERFIGEPAAERKLRSDQETILILPEGGATLRVHDTVEELPARAVAIIPPGDYRLMLSKGAGAYALTTGRIAEAEVAINASDYRVPDDRVAPVPKPLQCKDELDGRVRSWQVDDVPFPKGNPRLKFFQSATMSINWVEYDGPRDRTKLSPHAHKDFEQGSLAIKGDFVHHIRTPWSANADNWCDDQHIHASADSMLIIPPELIHTTEGIGPGHHILIDVFAPPRTDFVEKGWVFNAADYRA